MLKASAQRSTGRLTEAASIGATVWAIGVALWWVGKGPADSPLPWTIAVFVAAAGIGAVAKRAEITLLVWWALVAGLAVLSFGFYLHFVYGPALVLLLVAAMASLAQAGSVTSALRRMFLALVAFWVAGTVTGVALQGVRGILAGFLVGVVAAAAVLRSVRPV